MFRFPYIPNGKPFRSVFEDNECKSAGSGAYLYGLIAKGNEEFSGPYRANLSSKFSRQKKQRKLLEFAPIIQNTIALFSVLSKCQFHFKVPPV